VYAKVSANSLLVTATLRNHVTKGQARFSVDYARRIAALSCRKPRVNTQLRGLGPVVKFREKFQEELEMPMKKKMKKKAKKKKH
jgi:hypothetical protein